MNPKIKKIDAIIVVAMIAVAGIVLYKVGYIGKEEKAKVPSIKFIADEENGVLTVESVSEKILWEDIDIEGICDISQIGKYVTRGDKITDCSGTIKIRYKLTDTVLYTFAFPPPPELPMSLTPGNMRDISPDDEGAHFNKISNTREWWYYTVVFDENSGDLAGYVATIGFCHLAWGDLIGTFKPNLLVVTLHGPNGEEYGGIINEKRGGLIGLGLIGPSTLEASSPGVDVKFGDSWAKGNSPNWHVHAEDGDIDKNNDLVMDLDYFASSSGLWTHSSRLLDKGEGCVADYIFLGCEVTGTVKINDKETKVTGVGHYEHSWSPGILKVAIKGWDWCHMTLDNGWNIYYGKYYLRNPIIPDKTTLINPISTLVITTNKGETLTILEDLDITIEKTDKLSLLIKLPSQINVKAKPNALTQPLLRPCEINLDIDIAAKNTYDKIWRIPNVGMRVGLNSVSGKISWSDDDGAHEIKLNGVGTIWNMRKL